MSLGLAIETSSRVGTLALVRGATVLEERAFPHGLQNAAHIIPIIDALCRTHGCGPMDVETVHVSVGPGSFTGLRLAVTLAKTLAFATGAKIVAVPSTRVLAENGPEKAAHLLVVLDARRGRVYSARFERTEGRWIERELARLDRLADALARCPRPVYLLGEGIPYHRDQIPDEPQFVLTDESLWQPRAAVVARLGQEMAGRGEFADPYTLVPTYLRLPEAEEKRLEATL